MFRRHVSSHHKAGVRPFRAGIGDITSAAVANAIGNQQRFPGRVFVVRDERLPLQRAAAALAGHDADTQTAAVIPQPGTIAGIEIVVDTQRQGARHADWQRELAPNQKHGVTQFAD